MKKIYQLVTLSMIAGCLTGFAQVPKDFLSKGDHTANSLPMARSTLKATPLDVHTPPADITVSGKVTDDKGITLPGVSVVVKGTTQGTTTDNNGGFKLAVPNENAVLVFSFVGYVRQELLVGSKTTLTIALSPDDQTLNEVVVVGYGSQRKQDITSAVSVINMKDIGEQPANNPNQILQGRAPGVVVKQKSGAPGGLFEVRVRGISSLGAVVIRFTSSMGLRWVRPSAKT